MVDPSAPDPRWWIVRRLIATTRLLALAYPTRERAMARARQLNHAVSNPQGIYDPNCTPSVVRYLVVGRHEVDAYPHLFSDG